MGIQFNAEEVFAVAIKIEENAIAFYRRAASLNKDKEIVKTLENLETVEEKHKKIYTEMKNTLKKQGKEVLTYDPYDEAMLYLKAMADVHGGEGSPEIAGRLTGKESLQEIINIALGLEKKSILYYVGLLDLVPEKLGKDKISLIIAEEKKHVVLLNKLLSQL
jgi:rubrerythrin